MHGDFSLNPLAYRDGVSRVLFQQGRVQLDSDANAQTEAHLRFLRGLAFDLIGAHGGVGDSFMLTIDPKGSGLLIQWGDYYVDGIRCVNLPAVDIFSAAMGRQAIAQGVAYATQPNYFPPDDGDWTAGAKDDVLFYLDVFERHVSAGEDDSLREPALLGVDTASRAVVVWQVRALPAKGFLEMLAKVEKMGPLPPTWDAPYVALNLLLRSNVLMRARAVITEATDPCTISPDARYRGVGNRLFRVEIHDPGTAKTPPTFKWSADNAAIVYPVDELDGKSARLTSLGRDDRTAIAINDWVEVVDDKVLLMGVANPLLQVVDIRPHDMTVVLSEEPKNNVGTDPALHPILRRWDSEPVALRPAKSDHDAWFELADGVEVQFSTSAAVAAYAAGYRTGDYWLIPARTATGDVQWPQDKGHPRAISPHGVDHHYAPLAIGKPAPPAIENHYRRSFDPLAKANAS